MERTTIDTADPNFGKSRSRESNLTHMSQKSRGTSSTGADEVPSPPPLQPAKAELTGAELEAEAELNTTAEFNAEAENEFLQEAGGVQFLRTPPRNLYASYYSQLNLQKENLGQALPDVQDLPSNEFPQKSFDRTSFHYTRQSEWKYLQASRAAIDPPEIVQILPPAEKFIEAIMIHIIEILNGQRPAKHLQTWMSPPAYQALVRRMRLGLAVHGGAAKCAAPQVRRVRLCMPNARAVEAGVVLFDGRRMRAAALRLEICREKWRIVEIEVI